MKKLIAYWTNHGTKLLGTAAMITSGLTTVSGLIPDHDLKYWSAANVILGALTIKRGFTNSQR